MELRAMNVGERVGEAHVVGAAHDGVGTRRLLDREVRASMLRAVSIGIASSGM